MRVQKNHKNKHNLKKGFESKFPPKSVFWDGSTSCNFEISQQNISSLKDKKKVILDFREDFREEIPAETLHASVCACIALNTKCFCLNSYFQAGTDIFQQVQPGQISCSFPQRSTIFPPHLTFVATPHCDLSLRKGLHFISQEKALSLQRKINTCHLYLCMSFY